MNYDSLGIRATAKRNGWTRLWGMDRGDSANVRGTYRWATSRIYPEVTEETRRRLD